jgi:hypothetical protein
VAEIESEAALKVYSATEERGASKEEDDAAYDAQGRALNKLDRLCEKALRMPAPHADAVSWKIDFITKEMNSGAGFPDFLPEAWPVFVADIKAGHGLAAVPDGPPRTAEQMQKEFLDLVLSATPAQRSIILLIAHAIMGNPPGRTSGQGCLKLRAWTRKQEKPGRPSLERSRLDRRRLARDGRPLTILRRTA